MAVPDFSLSGKVALLTGASRGIGRAIALGYARSGADVIAVSRKQPDLDKVCEEIRLLGRKALGIAANVSRVEEVGRVLEDAKRSYGKVDILVNNAGGSPGMASLLDVDTKFWDKVMDLNLRGPVFLSQAVARLMKEQGGGTIINIASVDAFKPDLVSSPYTIAKSALVGATKAMALEWAKYNIRVNAIAPGQVHTRFGDSRFSIDPEHEKYLIEKTPQHRIADPDEIVGAAVYLASNAASFVTGATFVIDGGWLLA